MLEQSPALNPESNPEPSSDSDLNLIGGSAVSANHPITLRSAGIKIPSGQKCSAAIIADNAVLTAAHCFNFCPASLSIEFGNNLNSPAMRQEAKGIILHPLFSIQNEHGPINDIAIIILKEKIAPPFQAFQLASSQLSIAIGDTVGISGFGTQSASNQSQFGQLRWGTSQVLEITGQKNTIAYGISNTVADCYGDSGGPMFVNPASSNPLLTGIHHGSYVRNENGQNVDYNCQGAGVYTDTRAYNSWIVDTLTDCGEPGNTSCEFDCQF